MFTCRTGYVYFHKRDIYQTGTIAVPYLYRFIHTALHHIGTYLEVLGKLFRRTIATTDVTLVSDRSKGTKTHAVCTAASKRMRAAATAAASKSMGSSASAAIALTGRRVAIEVSEPSGGSCRCYSGRSLHKGTTGWTSAGSHAEAYRGRGGCNSRGGGSKGGKHFDLFVVVVRVVRVVSCEL